MRRPRLHRSLALWAGIFLMAFLGWAWWQSWHKVTTLWSAYGRYECANGGALVSWVPGRTGPPKVTSSDQAYSPLAYTPRDILWPQGYRGKEMEPVAFLTNKLRETPGLSLATRVELYVVNLPPEAWVIYFPFPFLLLLTLLLWLAALTWRARRLRKLQRASAIEG